MPTKLPGKSTSKPTKDKKQRLVLLDAHAIIHRAYHALPEFATASGEPTGALYGLSTMLIKIIEDLKPDFIVSCFDLPDPTHRHVVYENYKGTRKKTDDNLSVQIDRSLALFAAWGIPVYSQPGFEADDILGTITEELKNNKNIEIIIASGDMDTMQLVDKKRVQVYTLKRGLNETILYDEKGVEERFGFGPELLPDYKGLRGDPSDNIIGVKGIGEKTATELIQAFGSIEDIYKNLKKGGPRLAEALAKAGITERIKNLLLENEEEALFSKTLATIRRDAPIDFRLPARWDECMKQDELIELFRVLEFRTMGEKIRMLLKSSGSKTNSSVFTRQNPTGSDALGNSLAPAAPIDVPEDRELELALWVVDSNLSRPTMADVFAFTKAATVEDAWKVVNTELDKRNQREIYERIEKPLISVVEEMNKAGVKIDRSKLEELSKSYHAELSKLEKRIWEMAGEEFNISSPKQLGEILFTKLGLGEKRQKKTATGGFSTKESELEKLRDKNPIIDCILEYRELSKLLGTYIDAIPKLLDDNSRLHSTFQLAGTTTGRMASDNPNLQNIPIKSALGRAIRYAFTAEKGYSLLSLDYSQIELRIAAILSKDQKLVDIFKRGEDVHTGVAARVFKVREAEVDKEMRRKAKTINFGILYGMGVNALKTNLKTERKEAQEFYNNYFETFKDLAAYLDSVKADAERKGYTETMYGRRRYFAGFKSALPFIRASAERMAINAPIQGTEADIVKIAMARIDNFIKEKGWHKDARLVLQVHDEIVFEVRDDIAHEAGVVFKKIMEEVMDDKETLGVPIIAEGAIGKNWEEMKDL